MRPEREWGDAGEAALPRMTNFEALFIEHFEGIFRLLYRLTGSRDEAEDLAQETFLRCYRRQPEDRGSGLRPWLYRVALHLGYNAVRDRRRRRSGHRAARDSAAAVAAGDALEDAARAEERRRVRRALEELPLRQARMLLLRYAGLSYQELAEAMSISPASVGTLLRRAEASFAKAYVRSARPPAEGEGIHV